MYPNTRFGAYYTTRTSEFDLKLLVSFPERSRQGVLRVLVSSINERGGGQWVCSAVSAWRGWSAAGPPGVRAARGAGLDGQLPPRVEALQPLGPPVVVEVELAVEPVSSWFRAAGFYVLLLHIPSGYPVAVFILEESTR